MAHIYMDRGKSNPLNQQMLVELGQVLDDTQTDPAIEGIILHGKEGFFSAGLDLIELYTCDEIASRNWWQTFVDLVCRFVAFDKPAIAAVSGHSPAGGCVLALCCDYRVMIRGDFIIGLNEIPVGLPIPEAVFRLYGFWLGHAAAYRSLLEGRLFNPEEARHIGLVDELVDPRSIRTAAERQLRKYTQYERNTWQQSKRNMRRSLVEALVADREDMVSSMLKQWWSPTTRAIVKTIIDNLKRQ